jgi:hypothetical protein
MLKISPEDAKVFEDLMLEGTGLQNATAQFLAESQKAHAALQFRAKAHWDAVKAKHGIEGGDWHYNDGKLHPVQQQPTMPAGDMADLFMTDEERAVQGTLPLNPN